MTHEPRVTWTRLLEKHSRAYPSTRQRKRRMLDRTDAVAQPILCLRVAGWTGERPPDSARPVTGHSLSHAPAPGPVYRRSRRAWRRSSRPRGQRVEWSGPLEQVHARREGRALGSLSSSATCPRVNYEPVATVLRLKSGLGSRGPGARQHETVLSPRSAM